MGPVSLGAKGERQHNTSQYVVFKCVQDSRSPNYSIDEPTIQVNCKMGMGQNRPTNPPCSEGPTPGGKKTGRFPGAMTYNHVSCSLFGPTGRFSWDCGCF